MNQVAAFRATYSDWKLIRSRKVVQIVLEVPLELADRAYEVLGGMPDPAAETWCAIARLNGENATAATTAQEPPQPAPEAEPQTTPVRALRSYAQRAGMLCGKPAFWLFCRERGYASVKDKDSAADYVREVCGVGTRAAILPGTQAATRFDVIESAFIAWDRAPASGVA